MILKKSRNLTLLAVTFVLFSCCNLHAEETLKRYERSENHMGTTFALRFYASSERVANQAATEAFARIGELDDRLSDYKSNSELNKLNRTAGKGEAAHVSQDLWRVLKASVEHSKKSNGAFDITAAPAIRLWRRARRTRQLPDAKKLLQVKEAIGYKLLALNEKKQTAELTKPKMRLDLGGIAKGFAADEAIKILAKHGVKSALVDAGGDLALSDPPPGKDGWTIGILSMKEGEEPKRILLSNCGVATSGDAYQFVEIAGKRYSHIIDPRTVQALSVSSNVTVIAKNGTEADALASAMSVLEPKLAIKLADSLQGVAVVILRLEDDIEETKVLQKHLSKQAKKLLASTNPKRTVDESH